MDEPLQLLDFFMQRIEATHLGVIINEPIDEFLLSVWNDAVTVVGYQSQKPCLFYFLQLFGNIDDEIGQGLHFLLSIFEILHILRHKKVTK